MNSLPHCSYKTCQNVKIFDRFKTGSFTKLKNIKKMSGKIAKTSQENRKSKLS